MADSTHFTRFDRSFFDPAQRLKQIGEGSIGGKARGLDIAQSILASRFPHEKFPSVEVSVPSLTVISTDHFDQFMLRNGLEEEIGEDRSDEAIARAFHRGDLPAELVGDLRALVEQVRQPLAIRSSSMLEDALQEPLAGVYQTKMTPNNQASADERFRKLTEAIKLVYASTYFREAREARAAGRSGQQEKMAVIIQEVVGTRAGDRFYPQLSGVARSWNYYPMGRARADEGVVSLALGLGKTIVDGGVCWTYSPAWPASPPPYASAAEIAAKTQAKFWAVNMGRPQAFDPLRETEYLLELSLTAAEEDGSLRYLASTYDRQAGRISLGTGIQGPRVLDFGMILVLREVPLNEIILQLLSDCQAELGVAVEIELAMTFHPHRFGLLQVRPMRVSSETVSLSDEEMAGAEVVAASNRAVGNGTLGDIRDVVFVDRARFEGKHTRRIAQELEQFNRELVAEGKPYVLIGFGRWGSSDPWLGIPVNWAQISGARVIVEAMRPEMNVEPSQGSHFFHNLIAFQIPYLSIPLTGRYGIDWDWLEAQPVVRQTSFVRRVATDSPLTVKVDGSQGRGVIRRAPGEE